ncbi:MAG: hypothetical protein B1H12_02345 [Desulfobacteraceae bacterium 4484_190.2]|nr:MAG: hypothetical protein B1H12_02345 [Desulfobacteraceae bacterium 4484_190.2]
MISSFFVIIHRKDAEAAEKRKTNATEILSRQDNAICHILYKKPMIVIWHNRRRENYRYLLRPVNLASHME